MIAYCSPGAVLVHLWTLALAPRGPSDQAGRSVRGSLGDDARHVSLGSEARRLPTPNAFLGANGEGRSALHEFVLGPEPSSERLSSLPEELTEGSIRIRILLFPSVPLSQLFLFSSFWILGNNCGSYLAV